MFLPIGDSPNPERFTPWINHALIAANVLIFFATFVTMSSAPFEGSIPAEAKDWVSMVRRSSPNWAPSQYDILTAVYGYKPGASEIVDLFASMFLHGGWMHLIGNMLFLWIYGNNVEHRVGHIRYLFLYLVTGVAATFTFSLMSEGSIVPLIGASGAISGVLGMYFIMFPRNVVKIFALIFPFFFGVYTLNARLVLGFYFVAQNIFPWLLSGAAGGGVAYGAHIGGFVAGLIVALLVEDSGKSVSAAAMPRPSSLRGRKPPLRARPKVQTVQRSSAEEAFRDAVQTDDRAAALKQIDTLTVAAAARTMPDETLKVAQWLTESGQTIRARELLRAVLKTHRAGSVDQSEVYYTLGLIRLKQGQPTSAYQHFMDALDFSPRPETEERIRKALTQINIYRRRN